MKRKKLVAMTGLLGGLGLLAALGHRYQVKTQAQQEAVVREVRSFFEAMGPLDVVYVTEANSRAGETRGGVVFDDGVVFEFRHYKGQIDYKQLEEGISHD